MGVGGSFHIGMQVFIHTYEKLFFDTKNTLSLEEPAIKPVKTCLKDDGNKNFVVIKYKEFQFD